MTKKPAAEKAVSAVKTPRAVRPSATRVTSARHTKTAVASEPIEPAVFQPAAAIPQENMQEAIAKIAYGYWEARGHQGGNSTEDWFHAEAEYRQRSAAL